jgi:hypothetical protein
MVLQNSKFNVYWIIQYKSIGFQCQLFEPFSITLFFLNMIASNSIASGAVIVQGIAKSSNPSENSG